MVKKNLFGHVFVPWTQHCTGAIHILVITIKAPHPQRQSSPTSQNTKPHHQCPASEKTCLQTPESKMRDCLWHKIASEVKPRQKQVREEEKTKLEEQKDTDKNHS